MYSYLKRISVSGCIQSSLRVSIDSGYRTLRLATGEISDSVYTTTLRAAYNICYHVVYVAIYIAKFLLFVTLCAMTVPKAVNTSHAYNIRIETTFTLTLFFCS